ncbi:MAG: 7TM diverse intracellular signaling domain-containing protein, partial [Leptospirales bacterium]
MTAPRVVDGVIDLRAWDFEGQGPVELNGDWRFYWRRFIPPAEFASRGAAPLESGTPATMLVPGRWNGRTIDGNILGGDGFATYRLRILLDPERLRQAAGDSIYAFRLRRMYTAYRLFLNGAEIVQVGQIGEAAAAAVPRYRTVLRPVVVSEAELDLVLHISNYHHLRGGVPVAVVFGTEANIRAEREARLAFDLFLIGGLLILGLYQLGLYVLSKVDRSPILLGLFCLIIALRHFIDDERYVDDVFQNIPWHILHRMTYATFATAVILGLEHIHRFFAREAAIWLTRCLQSVAAAFLAVAVVATPRTYVAGSIALEITAVLSGIYMIAVVGVALYRRRNESLLFGLSLLCLVPGVIYKILYDRGHWSGVDLLPLGLFGFVFGQTLAVSKRFS